MDCRLSHLRSSHKRVLYRRKLYRKEMRNSPEDLGSSKPRQALCVLGMKSGVLH